jgi:hypothetical protein
MTSVKRKRIKLVLIFLFGIVLMSGFVGYKMYTKPHRNVAEIVALKAISLELANDYETNESIANAKYLDKVMEVNGEIVEVGSNQKGETIVALKGTDMSGVRCTLANTETNKYKTGDTATLKGICTGYLTDVILVNCINSKK